jgi:hypothetical protein
MTPDQTEKLAQQTLETARTWRQKGDVGWERNCVSDAVMDYVRVSLWRFDNAPDAIDYLRSRDVGCLVRRLETLNNALYRSFIESHGAPGAAVENDIDAVHVAWLVDEWVPANSFLAVCADDFVRKVYPVTRFWAEYYRAVQSLASRVAYDPVMQKACGYERYLIPYLYLIADLTNSRDASTTRAKIVELFAKRNRDKRLRGKLIDGDGHNPVRWDFRETSILKYWEQGPGRVR